MKVVRRLVPLLVLGVLIGAYLGYRWWLSHQPYVWSGTVEARVITVGSRAGGRVAEVHVREGELCKAGQALITLEPGDLPAQRLIAQAQVARAEAALSRLENGARPEEIAAAAARAEAAAAAAQETRTGARSEELGAARARLETAQAAADKAELDADRVARLRAAGAVSAAEADGAALALRAALAQRDVLARNLDQLQNGARSEQKRQASARASEAAASARLVAGGARVEDLAAARAEVDAARGRLMQVEVMEKELVVTAPRDARVESLALRPGDLLAPGAPAATLLEDGQLYVRIYVPETLIGRIHPGQTVQVKVDSFARTFAGVIEHIATVGEYSPRNLQTADERANQVFATRIGLREGKDQLRAGMAASIQVPR